MRRLMFAALAAATLAGGCERASEKTDQTSAEQQPAAVAPPPAKPAPMAAERLAVCAGALEAWSEVGRGATPSGVAAADAKSGATLIGMRRMELSLSDSAATDAAIATALAAWKDKTPSDIEAAAAACLNEIRG